MKPMGRPVSYAWKSSLYLWENSKTQGKKSEIEILAPMILYKELSSPKLRQKVPHVHEAVSWSQFPERVSGLCWFVVSQGFALSGLALSPLLSPPSGGRVSLWVSAQELVFGCQLQQLTASFRSWCPHFLPQQKAAELSRVPLQVTFTAESHLPCWAGKLCHLLGEGTALCEHVPFIPTMVHVAISHRSPVWTALALGEARQRQSPTWPFWI